MHYSTSADAGALVRIKSGSISQPVFEAALDQYKPKMILLWADKLLFMPNFDDIMARPSGVSEFPQDRKPQKPAVPPMYESRDGYAFSRELAKRLGLADYFPWETLEDKIKAQCQLWNLDYAELSQKGCLTFPKTTAPYITPENEPVFKTPSGKIELYSKTLEQHGFDPVPQYVAIEQPPDGYFRLLYGRSPVHSFTRTTNNALLINLFKENEVWINAKKAKALGVKSGDHVILVNQDGARSNKVKVKATQRIREDCVYMVHGFDSSSKELRLAYGKGADDQGLVTRYAIDPICGSTGMRVNFVKVEREA